MNKRFLSGRLLPVWIAVSAALIIVGIVMYAMFGFNYSAPGEKTVEVDYDAVIYIEGKEDKLAEECEKAFESLKIVPCEKRTDSELDMNYVSETGNHLLVYTFDGSVSSETLSKAASDIAAAVKNNTELGGEVNVAAHTFVAQKFTEANWRGAVALGVAAIVALVYVGFRFGWAHAIAGLAACANDVLLTLSIFAFTRIPVYAYAPLLYAGLAAVFSAILWLVQCMKLRENSKEPAYASLTAQEAVGLSVSGSWKFALWFLIPLAVALAVLGGLASGGLRLFLLPALLPLAVSVYSSFLLAPAVLVPLKSKFDAIKSKSKRYVGKKKAEAQE